MIREYGAFPLPLSFNRPPAGLGWDEWVSALSATSACNSEVNRRDTLLGQRCCMVCGSDVHIGSALQNCYVIRDPFGDTALKCFLRCLLVSLNEGQWRDLKTRGWIPRQAQEIFKSEPRNCLLMCPNHPILYDKYGFFICFVPDVSSFNPASLSKCSQEIGAEVCVDQSLQNGISCNVTWKGYCA